MDPDPDPPDPDPDPPDPDPDPPDPPRMVPGHEWLLRGYDVFGQYADESALKPPICRLPTNDAQVDTIGGKEYLVPNMIDAVWIGHDGSRVVHGRNLKDLQRGIATSFSASAQFDLFSESIEADYTGNLQDKTSHSFSRSQYFSYMYRLECSKTAGTLADFYTSEFSQMIDAIDVPAAPYGHIENDAVELLLKHFGAHYVSAAIFGGRLTQSSSIRRALFKTDQELTAAADLFLEETYNASITLTENAKLYKSEKEYNAKAVGGNPAITTPVDPAQVSNWIGSVPSFPALVDFVPGKTETTDTGSYGSLLGIWELIEDEELGSYLRYYWQNIYAPRVAQSRTRYPAAIKDVRVTHTHEISPPVAAGWTVVQGDLNLIEQKRSAGSFSDPNADDALFSHIAFGTDKTPNVSKELFVSRLHVGIEQRPDAVTFTPPGFERLTPTLSYNFEFPPTFGHLFVLKEPFQAGVTILDILVIVTDRSVSPETLLPAGYSYILRDENLDRRPTDVADGSMGKSIYIAVLREW